MVPDPEAKVPEDWDIEMDGEWEAPLIANPKCTSLAGCGKWSAPLIDNPSYKGKWKASMISNPAYKGKWAPRKIPNPHFYEDLSPFKTLASIDSGKNRETNVIQCFDILYFLVAFELWTISDNIAFDNILITDNIETANLVSSMTFEVKKEISDEESDNFLIKVRFFNWKFIYLYNLFEIFYKGHEVCQQEAVDVGRLLVFSWHSSGALHCFLLRLTRQEIGKQ